MATATVYPDPSPSHPTRRDLLAGAALVAPASVLLALTADPDPHPAWLRRVEAIRAWLDGPGSDGLSDEETDGPFDEACRLEELIATTPAATLDGLRAQVAVVHHNVAVVGGFGWRDADALANVLATLDRLAGRA